MISKFEEWYATEFDIPNLALENAYNASLQQELKDMKDDSVFGGSHQEDDE